MDILPNNASFVIDIFKYYMCPTVYIATEHGVLLCISIYTVSGKKRTHSILGITLTNLDIVS